MKTKITAKYIIGFQNNDHVIYENGELVYEDDTILFVGHASPFPADRLIDAGEAIVSPGFIDLDAVWDIDHAIYDAFVTPEQAKGLEWSQAYFNSPRTEIFSADEEKFRREYALIHLVKNGITTALPISGEYHKHWAETYAEFTAIADLCSQYGMRAYLGPSYRSGVMVTDASQNPTVLWDLEKGKQGLREAVQFVKDYDGKHGGLIKGFLAPARIQTCSKDLLQETIFWGQELDCPVRLHACQEDNEVSLIQKWYGKTPLTWLHEIGFLTPRTLIPHATHIAGHHKAMKGNPSELSLLSDTGVTVVHCPTVEARYGVALDSFEKYRAAGVNLGLGTDTFPPDMIRVMDYGLNLSKIMEGNQWTSKPADFFRAATNWGAKALGRDDLGKLEPGAKADIIIIDLSQFETGVIDDPIRTLLLNCTGSQVRTSIINGRIVMQDGQVPGMDVERMRADAQAYFDKMKSAYSERDFLHREISDLIPSEFKILRPSHFDGSGKSSAK